MTVDPRVYHRTYNILRLSGRQLGPADLAPNMDELKEARAKYRGLPDRQALDLLRADKLRNPLPVHDAIEDTESQYRAARIEEKRDQNFEKFATPWELIWSRLVMYWDSRLTPVVDSSGLVVNYTGNIDYKYFLIDYVDQEGPTPVTADTGMEPVEVLKHYRLFVGTNNFYGRTDLKPFGSSTITRHTVVTDIFGEVMSYSLGERNDDSITPVSLLEIWGALTLARDVIGLIKAIGKYGLRTLIRRFPTRRPPTPPPGGRIRVGDLHPRVKGQPANLTSMADKEREIHAANRFAIRADAKDVHLGDEARKYYNAPEGTKFPDVVAKKNNGTFALSEGKGTDINSAIKQFQAATPRIRAAETVRAGGKGVNVQITEQEVVIERLVPMPVQGGTLMSPGPGFGVDKEGFLLDARGFVDLKAGMPARVMEANGVPIRVITMHQ